MFASKYPDANPVLLIGSRYDRDHVFRLRSHSDAVRLRWGSWSRGNILKVDGHVKHVVKHLAFCAMTDTDMARKPHIGNTPKSMAARNLDSLT